MLVSAAVFMALPLVAVGEAKVSGVRVGVSVRVRVGVRVGIGVSVTVAVLVGCVGVTVRVLVGVGESPMVSVALLAALHERAVAFYRALTPGQFLRGLMHPENGRMTIEQVLALYAWHGDHHIAHIMSFRERERLFGSGHPESWE